MEPPIPNDLNRIRRESIRLRPLWIAVFIDILGFSIILPFLPYFIAQYHTTPFITGLLMSSNAIVGFICGPILAKISDKFGRKKILQICQIGTFFAFLTLAFSRNMVMLFMARILDGIFSGQLPIAKATVGDVVSPKERSRHMTNIGLGFTLANLIGPMLGAFLSQFGVIGPGLVAGVFAFASIIFTGVYFTETLPAITKIEEPWHLHGDSIQKQSDSLMKNHKAMYLIIQYGFLVLAAGIVQSSLSLFSFYRLNLIQTEVGVLFTMMGVFQIFFRAFIFNPMRKKLGDTNTEFVGLTCYIIAFTMFLFANSFYFMIPLLIIFSLGSACSRGIISGFVSRVVDHRNQGKINGVTSALDSLGQMMGPIIGSLAISSSIPYLYGLILLMISFVTFGMNFHVIAFEFDKQKKIQ